MPDKIAKADIGASTLTFKQDAKTYLEVSEDGISDGVTVIPLGEAADRFVEWLNLQHTSTRDIAKDFLISRIEYLEFQLSNDLGDTQALEERIERIKQLINEEL